MAIAGNERIYHQAYFYHSHLVATKLITVARTAVKYHLLNSIIIERC